MLKTIDQLPMRKQIGDLAFATISDVHLCHPRVPISRLLATINRFFPDNDLTGELDYILVAGDLFDRLRTLADNEVYAVMDFMMYWLSMLKERGVRLRVLEGTPSHDRNQSQLIVTINNALGEKGCDLRYIDVLKIDHEEEFGINILYVPDEWRGETDQTWQEVRELMRQQRLDSVDIAIMHGMFGHQLPNGIMRDHHKASNYESIVNWFITVGHIHSSSNYGKIFAQGSPDRLSHNEEEAKGIFKMIVTPEKNAVASKFIVNDDATPFVTLDLVGLDMDPAIQVIKNSLDDMEYGNIRLLVDGKLFGDGILDSATELAGDKQIIWSKKVEKQKIKDGQDEAATMMALDLPSINKNTILGLTQSYAERQGYAPGAITEALALLEEYK
ncbi:hypothetical protein CZP2022_194 [Vibrio phage C-ZP2022]|nr:hypothetical protein CZP2022_194 [Vibrio phage C-ZP2022]